MEREGVTVIAATPPPDIEFPPCQVKGHDEHSLTFIKEHTQALTGAKAYTLECPTGMYRYFYIPTVWENLHKMARMSKPQWGWKE